MTKNPDLEIEKIAELARLEFNSEEFDQFVPTFEKIVGYFEQLENVDISGIKPTFHVVLSETFETPYRSDATVGSLSNDDALANSPDSRHGQFRVPKVIE